MVDWRFPPPNFLTAGSSANRCNCASRRRPHPALRQSRERQHGTEKRICLTFCIRSESNRRRWTMSIRHWPPSKGFLTGGRATRGESKVGGVLQFRFGDGGFDMKILELQPGKRVLWQVVDGPEEWLGTKISFDLKQNGDWIVVLFKHQGWKEPVEFMHHCSTKWAVFLLSLKSLLETGKGAAWPNEIKLDSWE